MTKAVKMAILDATPHLRSNRVQVDSVEASVVSSPNATSELVNLRITLKKGYPENRVIYFNASFKLKRS
jgi:hypothetical protein